MKEKLALHTTEGAVKLKRNINIINLKPHIFVLYYLYTWDKAIYIFNEL